MGPAPRMSSRSIVLRSSRTLPGQSSSARRSTASGANWRRRHPFVLRQQRREVRHQQRNVLAPLAERRHVDRHHVEPVEQVLAEPAGGDLRLELLVRRGEHAHVHRHGLGAADARDHAVLQHPQHLGLRSQTHVADLIEEERAAVGLLELPGAVRHRAGERPLACGRTARSRSARRESPRSSPPRTASRPAATGGEWRAPPAPCRCRSRR